MQASESVKPASIAPILWVNFIGSLGFSIVLPFLVFLVTRLGGNGFVYGVMGATYSFFQLIGAPILGRWSDRFGRRKILLLSQLGTLASWVVFLVALFLPALDILTVDSAVLGAFTITIPLVALFLARALDGITGGNVSVANAYLADITPESGRAAAFGKMAVSANLGFIFGPAIAGLLGGTALGEIPPVIAAVLISAAASLIIALKLGESRACVLATSPEEVSVRKVLGQEQRDCYRLELAAKLGTLEILRLPSIAFLMTLYFLVYLAFNFFYIGFPVHAATRLGWSLTETGIFFAVLSLMMVAVQGPILNRLSKLASDRSLISTGSLLLAAGFLCYISKNGFIIYAGTALLALGNGLMWPSLLSTISKAAGEDVQGTVQGFAGSVAAVASILGLLAGGLLYESAHTGVFATSAVVTLAVFILSLSSPSTRPGTGPKATRTSPG
jgi:DHA1 family tetracycline resistance protein-like MFS transporter